MTQNLITPKILKDLTGCDFIDLKEYDIYHRGKDVSSNNVYTMFRILAKTSYEHTIQGTLKIWFKSGMGYRNQDGGKTYEFLRAVNIRDRVTCTKTAFKRNSMVLVNGHPIALESLEQFIYLPIESMDEDAAVTKRRNDHRKKQMLANNLAFAKNGSIQKGREEKMHNILLPYYKTRVVNKGYFHEYMNDVVGTLKALHKEFEVEGTFENMLVSCIGSIPQESELKSKTTTRKRKSMDEGVENVVRNIPLEELDESVL